ncbi:hypothetical protein RRG08_066822 [Elysia crispata]|uniref:Uncharacterized protein n=1 Tax=Elysia crispata TaxID=231223 RepID=A0AAE0YB62_9GAST|nr:hypothetical protein RRG08_066822 [Elysia crispata]
MSSLFPTLMSCNKQKTHSKTFTAVVREEASATGPYHNQKDVGENWRGTPPLGHILSGSSTFSLVKINTTDNSALEETKPLSSTVFGKANDESFF